MTVSDIMKACAGRLAKIMSPAGLTNQIAVPVQAVIMILSDAARQLEEGEAKQDADDKVCGADAQPENN